MNDEYSFHPLIGSSGDGSWNIDRTASDLRAGPSVAGELRALVERST
jgi:hypothetical protein